MKEDIMGDIPVFRWSGEYFGFIRDNNFFDKDGIYLGWLEYERIWKIDGEFLGELIDENYILRNKFDVPICCRVPRTPPLRPIPPTPSTDRAGKELRSGWVDSLEEL
jgi:hypothetical protein